MSYIIYLRKSRQDSELESLGIDVLARHEKTLLELAKLRGLPVEDIYREVVSGDSIDARPEMIRLLSEVESGIWDGVLVMEVERLARGDTIDQGRVQRAFFYSGTQIITPAKTYDPSNEFDNEYFEFNLFMSRREYATIKRRMQNGRVRSVKDGYYVGSIPPYGWKRIRAQDGKHYTLTPDDAEAPILQLMYDFMGNRNYGYQRTCTMLSQMGITARNGKPFSPSTLKGIISNPANIGMVRWNYRRTKKRVINGSIEKSRPKAVSSDDYILVKAAHEGIIPQELFQRANTPRSAMSVPARTDRPIQNVFAGILYCSECGRIMVRKKADSKTPYDILVCRYAGCPTVGIRSDELESVLVTWLKNYIADYEFSHVHTDETAIISAKQVILHNLEQHHTTLLKQRSSLFDLIEQGIYTKELFTERNNALEKRISKCLNDITSVRRELACTVSSKTDRETFALHCSNLLDVWEKLDASGKNTALKGLIEKIVLTKTKKNTRGQISSDFTIDVYPKVPRRTLSPYLHLM